MLEDLDLEVISIKNDETVRKTKISETEDQSATESSSMSSHLRDVKIWSANAE